MADKVVEKILLNYGLFCEHIPYCFSTETLSKHIYELKPQIMGLKKTNSFPLNFTMSKNAVLRRTISIPNIILYLKLLFYYEENWNTILSKYTTKNSESSIKSLTNSVYKQKYSKSIRARIQKFAGYKVKLNVDISNCFDSIYTHSITWALCGKEEAKKCFKDKNYGDASLRGIYDIADNIDKKTRALNGNQTNGILTGPYSSYIFSEIIFNEIDSLLSGKKKDFVFTRYRDDFSFYFLDKDKIDSSIQEIAKIFKEYNLYINQEKIKVEYFPYDLLDDYDSIFSSMIENKDYSALLNKSLNLYNQGQKGAVKYAFNLLKDIEELEISSLYLLDLILSVIINMPEISYLGVKLLEKGANYVFVQGLYKRLNQLLTEELIQEHYHECMWIMYLITRFNVQIELSNAKRVLSSENDILIVMCLDYIQKNFSRVYSENKQTFNTLDDLVVALSSEIDHISNILRQEDYNGAHWLMAYEIPYNDFTLNKSIDIHGLKKYNFYSFLSQKKISFYTKIS